MKWTRHLNLIILITSVIGTTAAVATSSNAALSNTGLDYIKSETCSFAVSVHQLRLCIDGLNPDVGQTAQPVKEALISCRLDYKKISFFLDYFYPQQGKLFNGPPKKEVEEPYMEYEDPQSFQQIESILFEPAPQTHKKTLQNLALVLDESAAGLNSLYYYLSPSETQLTESLHLELIRIMTLYITGYDAPELKTGVLETRSSLESFSFMARQIFRPVSADARRLDSLTQRAIFFTHSADFDHFNRLTFLTQYALPMEEQLKKCAKYYGFQISSTPFINSNARNLFQGPSKDPGVNPSSAEIKLGQQLFYDKTLSGNNLRSCASCHQPDKFFTDRLVANRQINSPDLLRRNTPTLLYASDQSAQFWDGRASTLSEQIRDVLTNSQEMAATIPEIKQRLLKNPAYGTAFHDSVSLPKIEEALSAFLRTLRPMNSTFDRFMGGDLQALSADQKKGFNLFMGKAQCGSCHFAPVFNGSIPPLFNRTEYEVLGVPGLSAQAKYIPDSDLGRYDFYPVILYKGAFKTPTVRNVAQTGPYMHNGRFKSLKDVLEFYNRGGGTGIGLATPEQTLSKKPLHLSPTEVREIITFLKALTDDLNVDKKYLPHGTK
jgi:cytochrome c peroxidase